MLLSWIFSLLLGAGVAPAAPARPNILIILADDVGFSDIGCYGGEIRTPNIDSLAAGGLKFKQFYNSARCCPSRASLLTGLYPHQAGVGLMASDKEAQFPGAGDNGEKFPGYRGALNENCVTIGQVLKTAGYKTAAVGKWHVGDKTIPTEHGFDDFYGFISGYGVDSWEPRMMIRLPAGKPQRTYKPGEFFATDAITDHALDFLADMRKGGDAPWMMYVAYQAAHFPVQSRKEDMTGYAELYTKGWDAIRDERLARQKKIGLMPADTILTPRSKIPLPSVAKRIGSMSENGKNPAWDSLPADRRADLAQRMAVYAGMISGMDRNIGRILEDLRKSGQMDNTLILFMSDNGACAEWEPFGFEMNPFANAKPGAGINQGTQGLPNKLYAGDELLAMGGPGSRLSYGSGWANACNTPFRLYKHYAHEAGISSPLVVHWPAAVKATNAWRAQPGHLIDLMATCVEVSGAKYPAELDGRKILPMEGTSLLPAFADQPLERKYLAFEHEGNKAIREGKWKLVSVGGGGWELYDMDADRVELKNLADTEPERVKQMAADWEEWAKRTKVLPKP